MDPSGNIWVTDDYNNRMQKFTSAGVWLLTVGGIARPQGVAVDSSGNVWVAELFNNRIKEFDSAGTLIQTLGSSGSGNGQFNLPTGVAFDSAGNLWVADSNNFRIQEFAPPSVPIIPPVITVPDPITGVEQTTAAGTAVTFTCSAWSPSGRPVTLTCVPASGSVFPLGTTVVTCTATDDSGNATTKTFTVEVVDTTPPVIEGAWAAPGALWSDGFEGPSLESGGWTIQQQNTGVMSLSTDFSHSGQQSAKFTPYNGGQKGLCLGHSLGPLLQEGTLSCWFYDGGYGMYVHLQATKGTSNDPAAIAASVAAIGVQDWDGTYYHATGGLNGPEERTTIPRSTGWHHFEIVCSATGVTTKIDGAVAGSLAGDYRFDGVMLDLEGPHYSGPSYYFDDVSVTPVPEPVPPDVTAEQTSRDGTPVDLGEATASDICDADVEITNDAPTVFPLGTTVVTWTATDDSGNVATAMQTVTVVDTTLPVLVPPEDVVAEQVNLDGTPIVTGEAVAIDICDAAATVTNDAPAVFPLGETVVTWTATDASGNVATAAQKVTVVDTTPPEVLSVHATPDVLWPANHKMVDITIAATLADICDAAPAWKIVGVASNEPINGLGDGDTAPDWLITGDQALKLRAERGGKGSGRVYTITIQATDASGNASTAQVTVAVPHDKKR